MWSDQTVWRETELIDRRGRSLVRHVANVFRRSAAQDVVIIVGSLGRSDLYCDLIAALSLKFKVNRPWVIVTDATWEVGSRALAKEIPFLKRLIPKIARTIVRILDHEKVIYCVLSRDEVSNFTSVWGVNSDRVKFTPYYVTLDEWEKKLPRDDGYLFAGGNSLRDYSLLVESVRDLDLPVKIATSQAIENPSDNVYIERMSHAAFMDALIYSKLVVVPLETKNRSAGQQTYLNAMAAAKPVIVTDAPGVRDYIEHGKTGIVVPNDATELRAAIGWVIDPQNYHAVLAMAQSAQETVFRKFSHIHYLDSVLHIAKQVKNKSATRK